MAIRSSTVVFFHAFEAFTALATTLSSSVSLSSGRVRMGCWVYGEMVVCTLADMVLVGVVGVVYVLVMMVDQKVRVLNYRVTRP